MAEKEIAKIIKLQIPAGKATPAPPVGPALGGTGINIMQFVKEFNDKTAKEAGMIIPIVLTVYKDSKIYHSDAKFSMAWIFGSSPVKILNEGIA